jgi:hypothetical protein
MNTPRPIDTLHAQPDLQWPPVTDAERDRVRDAAMERAPALRRAAMAEFWHDADAWWAGAIDSGQRAANRLAARLRQHAKRRAAASASAAIDG